MGINQFKEEEKVILKEGFKKYPFAMNFSNSSPEYLRKISKKSGVYFICATGPDLVKIYIGKAKNLQNRIKDYHRKFQVHCPNDRKMAYLQKWLAQTNPEYEIFLFTKPVQVKNISAVEAKFIKEYDPFVNATVQSDEESKKQIEIAYEGYFEKFFELRAVENS